MVAQKPFKVPVVLQNRCSTFGTRESDPSEQVRNLRCLVSRGSLTVMLHRLWHSHVRSYDFFKISLDKIEWVYYSNIFV